MNYHIIPQDKFFCTYIEDIYKIGEEANNVIFVRGNVGDSELFQSSRPVEYLGNDEGYFIERLKVINTEDKLFVSWYDIFIADAIIKSGIRCKVYAYLMGGEFYNDPAEYHDFWTFDRKTRYYIRRKQRQHGVLAFPYWTMYKLPYYLYDSYKHSKEIKKSYQHKLETLRRLDYIVTPKNNTAEIGFIKKLYPTFHAEHVFGGFDQNVEVAQSIKYEYEDKANRPVTVLLGNSGDPMNNHMDAIKYFKSGRLIDSKIICPFSYGNKPYIAFIERWLNNKLGSRFIALKTYMKRDDYVRFLSTIDVVVMNHNRQQAFGNTITALCLGKPVYMKKTSVVYSMLKNMGLRHVYDINELKNSNIDEIRLQAYRDREYTIHTISLLLSEEARLTDLRILLR